MENILFGLDDSSTLYKDLQKRVKDLSKEEVAELYDELENIVDAVDSETTLVPLYKVLAVVPDVYFRNSLSTYDVLVGLGKTLEVLEVLQEVLSEIVD